MTFISKKKKKISFILQTTKVDPTTVFEGCIASVYFMDFKLALWSTAVNTKTSVKCCVRPPSPPTSFTPLSNTISFDGFGYLWISNHNFSFVDNSHASFEMRTFDDEAVLFLLSTEGPRQYYGVFMKNGKVIFEYGIEGSRVTLESARTYNDGEWYQVRFQLENICQFLVCGIRGNVVCTAS